MTSSVKPLAGPGRDAQARGQPVGADGRQRVPDRLARVAGAVGVVQQQQVERVDPAALEAALGGHPDVVRVALGPAQARVGEAREALRALALALVEVVPDRAHQRVLVARDAGQRGAEQPVGLARPVGVGGDHGGDAAAGAHERGEALVVERLAEAHEAPAGPGAHRGWGQIVHSSPHSRIPAHGLPARRRRPRRLDHQRGRGAPARRGAAVVGAVDGARARAALHGRRRRRGAGGRRGRAPAGSGGGAGGRALGPRLPVRRRQRRARARLRRGRLRRATTRPRWRSSPSAASAC